ncbi:hypothetical protein [Aeromicrobium sp.]|uniref:hypothetical protein n=1 Tax=Aeromicrobium sp. TaxID=1871063 RepID=UPI0030BC5BE1
MNMAQPPSGSAEPNGPVGRESNREGRPTTPDLESRPRSIPQLYIACPLTGLDSDKGRLEETSHRIETVKRAVEEATVTDRIEAEQWPVSMHIPFENTRPGSDGGLSPSTVYDLNLDALLASDGLIVVTDQYCSAGIGQEIEWAARAGTPVLYLSRVAASRQILGTPHNVAGRTCDDAVTMAAHVRNWLSANRSQIQSGPTRRDDRALAYLDLTTRLRAAWEQSTNRSPLAAQLNLPPSGIDSIIRSPERVALTPWWTICGLAVLLSVSLEARRGLSFAESRAWVRAAEDGSWDARTAERMRIYAATTGATSLERPATWISLHSSASDA